MKIPHKIISLLAGTALLAASSLSAVTTDPVGYVTTDFPVGNTSFVATLINGKEFAGITSSVAEQTGQTVFSVSGLSSGAFDEGDYPLYFLMIESEGSNQGLVLDIISNDSSSITVSGEVLGDGGLSQTENISVRKHMTIGDFFGDAEGLTAFVDSLVLYNDDGTKSVNIWDGNKFIDGQGADISEKPIYPGQGGLFFCTQPVSTVIAGNVLTSEIKIPVFSGTSVNLIGAVTPSAKLADGTTDLTIGSLGFGQNLTPFVGSLRLVSSDGSLAPENFVWDGSKFLNSVGQDASNVPVVPGSSFFVSNNVPVVVTLPEAY